jgi:hypothetical protein
MSPNEPAKDTGTVPPHRIGWGYGGTMKRRTVRSGYIPGWSHHDGSWDYPLLKKPTWGATPVRTPDHIRCGKATMPDSVANAILICSVASKDAAITKKDEHIKFLRDVISKKDNEIKRLDDDLNLSGGELLSNRDSDIRYLKATVGQIRWQLQKEKEIKNSLVYAWLHEREVVPDGTSPTSNRRIVMCSLCDDPIAMEVHPCYRCFTEFHCSSACLTRHQNLNCKDTYVNTTWDKSRPDHGNRRPTVL